MNYSTDQVITFIHVVQAHSFTKAAAQLNLSKSVVSQRISALENYLQSQLFIRTTRKLTLTDAGAEFYKRVKSVFSDIEAAVEAIRTHQEVAKGSLSVIMPAGFARSTADQLIPQFIADHPQVHLKVKIVEDPGAHLDQEFDCLILPHIKGLPLPDFNFVAKKITSAPVGIYATSSYIKQRGKPTIPNDLLTHNCVAAFKGAWPFKQTSGELTQLAVPGNISVNNDEVMKSVVINHQAIGYAYSRLFEEEIANKTVVTLLKKYTQLEVQVYALYPQSYYMPYKLKAFLMMLEAHYTDAHSTENPTT